MDLIQVKLHRQDISIYLLVVGGGVYSILWTSNGIKIWHFVRSKIPDDIAKHQPEPGNWGKPLAAFSGDCKFEEKFRDQAVIFNVSNLSHFKIQIVFNINFCGDWAGSTWSQQCADKGTNCSIFVQENPEAFKESYWLINSLRVYCKCLLWF